MTNSTYIILDIETTGLSPKQGDAIIELGAIKIQGQEVIDTFDVLINPRVPIAWGAQAVHGMSDAYIAAHGQHPETVMPKFAQFCQQGTLVGHNIIKFDLPFIQKDLASQQIPQLTNPVIDTLFLARKKLQLPNYKLGTIARYYGIPYDKAHRALEDCLITKDIFLKLYP